MNHQEHKHSWNGSVMSLCCVRCLRVSVCDVRLYMCVEVVLSLCLSLSFLSIMCLHLINTWAKTGHNTCK